MCHRSLWSPMRSRASQRVSCTSRQVRKFTVTSNLCASREYVSSGQRGIARTSKEVALALHSGKPIVALESAIYTHGFPYPENIQLGLDLQEIVRSHGAVPATIAVIDGIATIGMTQPDLMRLMESAGRPETMKVSRKDLPYILGMGLAGRKLIGGTTVSGTMVLARRAGIKVFGTGGLGGVHRGGQDSMDISADLTELGRTDIAVISSGCKSFLDIPRTLEYLETQGVPVCTFADGRTGDIDFPSFFTRNSGIKCSQILRTPAEAAALIWTNHMLRSKNGLLLANPIPEEFSMPQEFIDSAINQAVQEAAEQGIHGHANTPFILTKIKELTKGNSLPANRALIESNITMAAQVAVELSALLFNPGRINSSSIQVPSDAYSYAALEIHKRKVSASQRKKEEKETRPISDVRRDESVTVLDPMKAMERLSGAEVIVFGSVALDIASDFTPAPGSVETCPQLHTSNLAVIKPSIGGVGHNVARAADYMSNKGAIGLYSMVADDLAGQTILSQLSTNLDGSSITTIPAASTIRTAQYIAVNDLDKNLVVAMADMDIFNSDYLEAHISKFNISTSLKWIVVDSNWKPDIAIQIMKKYSAAGIKVAFEPVSNTKGARILRPVTEDGAKLEVFPKHNVNLATPNQHELAAMHTSAREGGLFEGQRWWKVIDALGISSEGARDRFVSITNSSLTDQGVPLQSVQLLPFFPSIITKLGADGVLLAQILGPDDVRLQDPDHAAYILSRTFASSSEPQIGGVYMRLFPAAELVKDVVSVNGVGDTLLGVLIAGLAKGLPLDDKLIGLAQRAAVMTLRSDKSVHPEMHTLRTEFK
ncbi:Indigoidine synthase A like protein-domain-containing protein [Calycina marina]|uniref:Indigoidine synthase A like protein-domain-containing protein n=1 Tax=Calycina marina TaxID=1763456 RepID=A0A9P7Z5P0_9HELO|nr:Indigoidine synthase A like protein-domain-containing protein [Calycina marina]